MEKSTAVLIGMATLGLVALAAFAVYMRRQRHRVGRVEGWVKDY
jgi:multisubunit Na+/H+ antiporter MnhC subunit